MSRSNKINPERALELRKQGFYWREIGILLADEDGRKTPYLEGSVVRAVKR